MSPDAGKAYRPTVLLDRAMLPRIFFLSGVEIGSVTVARCTQRPCATDPSHWTLTLLAASTESELTAGKSPDGRTFFTSAINRNVIVG